MGNKNRTKNSVVWTVLMIIVSLLASLLLWVYVSEELGEEITKPFAGVLVQFVGEETLRESRGLIVSETSATSARVELTGNRRTVSALNATDLAVTVDLSRITTSGNYSMSPDISYPSRTDRSSITGVQTDPEVIEFYVDVLKSKAVEVVGEFNGSVAEGYLAGQLQITPAAVNVYGPEKVLAEIDHAYVDVSRTDVDRALTFDSAYVLVDAEGNEFTSEELTFDTETVSVTLPVSAVRDVALSVDFVYGGGVAEENVLWRLTPDTLTLTGDSEALAGVNSISVARIDLSQITGTSFTDTYRVVIPNDTEILSGAAETELSLELIGLETQYFTIDKSRINCVNVSEGYAAEIGNDSLRVLIRGPVGTLSLLSALNVRAVADLTQLGTATGSNSVPVRIYIDGSATAGAVGEYSVVVNIREAAEETGGTEETELGL